MNIKYIYRLIVSVIICEGAGFVGTIFTSPSIPTWYAALQQPPFTPPNWLFAPAWITLYLLMAISASLVWHRGLDNNRNRWALTLFLVQLILNVLWSVVFFGFKSIFGGIVVIVLLWVAILITILKFMRISALAGFLLIPYIGWVTFAAVLNISFFVLNS